jgi:hypothetical protein
VVSRCRVGPMAVGEVGGAEHEHSAVGVAERPHSGTRWPVVVLDAAEGRRGSSAGRRCACTGQRPLAQHVMGDTHRAPVVGYQAGSIVPSQGRTRAVTSSPTRFDRLVASPLTTRNWRPSSRSQSYRSLATILAIASAHSRYPTRKSLLSIPSSISL